MKADRIHIEYPRVQLDEDQTDALLSVVQGETAEEWEARRKDGAFLCGPRVPSTEDLAAVDSYRRWLAGDRTVWDSRGLPVCVDERGCPDPGTCGALLVCPRRLEKRWPGYPDPGKRCPICYPARWTEQPAEVALMPQACERVAEHPRPRDVADWQRRRR